MLTSICLAVLDDREANCNVQKSGGSHFSLRRFILWPYALN